MFSLNLGNLVVHLTAQDTQFKKIMARTEGTMMRASQKLSSWGKKLSLSVTAPLTAVAGLGVKAFAEFDDAMTQSLAIMGDVSEDMRHQMEETAKEISGRSITSATDLAKSYFYLASAGLSAEQSLKALPVVERFATAGMFDMATATSLLMDAQSALGLKVADANQNMLNAVRVSDTLVRANVLANASVEQFANALTNKVAVALRLLNKDVEEGVAVLAAFADQGIKDVEAGEKLHMILRDLQNSAMKAPQVWKKLGMSVYDSSGKMRNVADIVADLEKAFLGMSDQQKKNIADQLEFQDRSFSALQSLLGVSGKIREYEKALKSASGYTEDLANKQLKSFSSQMKILWNNIHNAAEEIGRILAPMLVWLGGKLRDVTSWWKGLSDTQKKWIVGIGAALAAIGPLLIALGTFSMMASHIIGLFSTLGLVGSLWVVVIGLVVAAVVLLTDALLQFFDAGNLGIIDLVNSFRVGGYKIGTWMQALWLEIFKAWEWCKTGILKGWESVKWFSEEIGGYIWRTMLRAAKGVSDGFWWSVRQVVAAFTWLSNKALDVGFASGLLDADEYVKAIQSLQALEKGVDDLGAGASEFYQKEIDKSLTAATDRYVEYYKTIDKMEKDYQDQIEVYDKTMDQIFQDDLEEQIKVAEKAGAAIAEAVKPVEDAGEKAGISTPSMSTGAFKEVNLNRFSLASPAGATAAETQQVKAPELESKMEEAVTVLKKISSNLTLK